MPSEVRFPLVRKALEEHAWTLNRINGSHHTSTKEGERSLPIPVHKGKVAPFYIRHLAKVHGIEV